MIRRGIALVTLFALGCASIPPARLTCERHPENVFERWDTIYVSGSLAALNSGRLKCPDGYREAKVEDDRIQPIEHVLMWGGVVVAMGSFYLIGWSLSQEQDE